MPDYISDKDTALGPAGSVYINNTSYSGCDIQIVVSIPDFQQGKKDEGDQMTRKINALQLSVDSQKRKVAELNTKISNVKESSSSYLNLVNTRSGLQRSILENMRSIKDLQARKDDMRSKDAPNNTKVLAEAQTLSLSVFRDKHAVRACGTVYPRGFTRGPRQIAGSLVFTVFNEHVLHRFLEAHATDFDAVAFTSALLDQLPPVDINVIYANEYGFVSRMAIYGVEFFSEGQVMSIEDILTEQTVQFVARDFDPMRAVSQRSKIDENSASLQKELSKRASDLIFEEDYAEFKNQISPFQRFTRRRDPFL